jgi:hypothetical protein
MSVILSGAKDLDSSVASLPQNDSFPNIFISLKLKTFPGGGQASSYCSKIAEKMFFNPE